MQQTADELEVVPRCAHDRRDRFTARAQLERCLDDNSIAIRMTLAAA